MCVDIRLFELLIMGLFIQGCFIQDFNQNARIAGYNSRIDTESSTSQATQISPSTQTYSHNAIVQELLRQQRQWQETPYISGGTQKNGADCSGFVMSVYNESFHLTLPRTTILQMQKGQRISGRNIKMTKLRAGDLVFFKTGRGLHGYHVGIYLENGDFIHLSTKSGAKIANLSNSYWKKRFKKAVRYLKS